MSLRNYRIPRGNRGSKIASADAVEGKWKVVRAEDDHWPDGRKARPNIQLGIERCALPRLLARCRGGLPQLIHRPWQLHILESRANRKRRLFMRGLHNLRRRRLNIARIRFEEGSHAFRLNTAQLFCRLGCSGECKLAIRPLAYREEHWKRLSRRRVLRLECLLRVRLAPFPCYQYLCCIHCSILFFVTCETVLRRQTCPYLLHHVGTPLQITL